MEDASVSTLELSELFADDILAFLSDIDVKPTNHTHQSDLVGGAEPGPSDPYNGVGLATALQQERERTTPRVQHAVVLSYKADAYKRN